MKIRNAFALGALLALGSQAAVRENWTFENDAPGTLLAVAVNSGDDGSTFAVGGAGVLEADGQGVLLSTPSASSLWDDAATLDAEIQDADALFLRYDLSYDLSSDSQTIGSSLGITFVDESGTHLAGLVFADDPSGEGGAPAGRTLEAISGQLDAVGTLSAIVKVDVAAGTMICWYDLNGGSHFDESQPAATNAISISSISRLRISATGKTAPSGTSDYVAAEDIRVADTWAEITEDSAETKYLNEWIFDNDAAGLTLAQAINSGSDGAIFSEDTSSVTQTDGSRGLVCANDVSATENLWSNGAVLVADVANQSSGVRFLRYDFDYDMTSASNDSGIMLGLAFSDGSDSDLAGIVLQYDVGTGNATPPTGIETEEIASLDPDVAGTLSVIAKVDLDTQTMSAWYSLTGDNSFSSLDNPDATTAVTLDSFDDLTFWGTGDFIATDSSECVVIDNIRTAATWDEVIEKPVNLQGPTDLSISVDGSLGDAMDVAQTNLISITINNSGSTATEVISSLTHDGGENLTIISSNNAPVSIESGGSVVQSFEVVANSRGIYTLIAQATSEEDDSELISFELLVGSRVSFDSQSVANDRGGIFPGEIEPNETFEIRITSKNDGGVDLVDVTNRLMAANASFFTSITAIDDSVYAEMDKGQTHSTTYRVVCSPDTSNGLHTFTVVNSSSAGSWSDTFQMNVRREAVPSVTPSALTVNVLAGEIDGASITLNNGGNAPIDYRILLPDPMPAAYYHASESQEEELANFHSGNDFDVFLGWNGTDSDSLDLEFSFAPFGVEYTEFTVSQYGTVTLKGADGATALLEPFATTEAADQSTVRYRQSDDQLIIAWGNGTDHEFQAWIRADGTVLYLYEYATWGEGDIGAAFGMTQSYDHTPGLTGRDGLLLSPTTWVSVSPLSGTVGNQSSQELTVTADATELQGSSSVSFIATVDWGISTDEIAVTVNVSATAAPAVSINPSPLSFSGLAGYIAHTNMTLSNTGNIPLYYSITDRGLKTGSYTVEADTAYAWVSVPSGSDYVLDANTLDSEPVDIGFPFTYFGAVYTNLTVGIDGTLTLGDSQVIVPYSASLSITGQSSVRILTNRDKTQFTVTWEGMTQSGSGDNQTFQAVLYRDTGAIRFNYQQLLGDWTEGVILLDQDTATSGDVSATLINDETTIDTEVITKTTSYTTNKYGFVDGTDTYTTNTVVNYTEDANRQSIEFVPGAQQILRVSPLTGYIPIGSSVDVQVTANGSSLSGDGENSVSTSTIFDFSFVGKTQGSLAKATTVTYTATNSVTDAYPATLAADMWGTESPLVTSTQMEDGSRSLAWPPAEDGLSRTYTVEYTTSLMGSWGFVATVVNGTSYHDTHAGRAQETVIFYRVTVK